MGSMSLRGSPSSIGNEELMTVQTSTSSVLVSLFWYKKRDIDIVRNPEVIPDANATLEELL